MKRPEILAPAGTMEALKAAVNCGADSVYFGGKALNARRNAENFDEEQLREAISYAHLHGTKLFQTLNIVMFDGEERELLLAAETAARLGVDAAIVQDWGVLSILKSAVPELPLYASTQMAVHNLEGAKAAEQLGCKRIVLAREMTAAEIEKVVKGVSAQVEVFVHGALCMSVSGQCYLSSMLGGRSGNRGLCAQPCRLPFSCGSATHALSLKDLSLVERVRELSDLGVSSLKIEGRMKRPEYVAAATKSCNLAVRGDSDSELDTALRAVFARSGFTDGYAKGKLSRDMFGTRLKEDVTAAKTVLPKLERLYDKEQPLIPVDFYLSIIENETVTLSGSAKGKSYFADSGVMPEKAINKPMTADVLRQRISKCGGTQFYANDVEIDLDDGLIVPSSVINALRREVLENLSLKIGERGKNRFVPINLSHSVHICGDKKIYIRLSDIAQLPDDLEKVETVYLPLGTDTEKLKTLSQRVKVGVEIPRGIFGTAEKVYAQLKEAKRSGINLAYATNLDGLAMARELEMEIHTGFTLNIFNTLSLSELEKLGVSEATVSVELTLQQIKKLGGKLKRGVIAYGSIPLMLTRNCPIRNGKTCDKCKSNSYLTDRMGVKFPVVCSNGCSEVLNSRPIYLADRLGEIENVDFITLYFTKESKSEVENVIRQYKSGEKPTGEFTRGLYYRGVE